MTENIAFHDLPADAFPLTIEFLDNDTGEVWHTLHADGPGVMKIPSGPERGVKSTGVIITYANGIVQRQ